MIKPKQSSAVTYIFAMMCLGILALLGIFFIINTTLEQKSSHYSETKRHAILVAQAALDFAVTSIPEKAMVVAYSNPNADHQYKDFVTDPLKTVETAINPSFYIAAHPKLNFAYSYKTDYQKNKAFATLKIIDANAFFNMNSPLGTHFDRLLGNILKYCMGYSNASTINNIVQAVTNWRNYGTPREYSQFSDLYHLVESGYMSMDDLKKFSNYVTVHSWGNTKSIVYGSSLSSPAREKRYPININIACKNVLKSVLSGIGNSALEISESKAETLATAIANKRKTTPFKTWNDVEEFLNNNSLSGLSTDEAILVFAAIYPGIRLNKKDPDFIHYRKYDKFDITKGTTEFSLFESGVFYIESLGRIVENEQDLIAMGKITTNIKIWEPHITTTQHDFEKNRKTSSNQDAWTTQNPSKPFDTASAKNEYLGSIFERNPESPNACRYWAESYDISKRPEWRPDGAYIANGKPLIMDDWNSDGFDLWLKPGYSSPNEYVIVEKHQPADGPGHIYTRCAYENSYVTLSRTYIITEGQGRPAREFPTRVFYGTPMVNNARTNLFNAGKLTYTLIVLKLNSLYQSATRSIIRNESEIAPFAEKVSRIIYGSFGSGHSSVKFPQTTCVVKVQTIIFHPDGSTSFQYANMTVTVTFHVQPNWQKAILDCSLGSGIELDIRKPLWMHIFSTEPTVREVNRTAAQKEAFNINEFPSDTQQTTYKYSRTEYRATITLEKGHWYHITGRWDDMLVTQLKVSSKKQIVDGVIQWDLIDGPMHVWPIRGTLKPGVYYYSPNSVIYHSPFRATGQVIRYWQVNSSYSTPSTFAGIFDLRDVCRSRCYFGVVNWTRYLAENKEETYCSITLKTSTTISQTFKNDGSISTTPTLSPLFRKPIDTYASPAVPPMPSPNPANRIEYEIQLRGNSAPYETSILDQIWLYLIIEPLYKSYELG